MGRGTSPFIQGVYMLEFQRKEFVFKLDGKEHRVKHPTVKQVQELQAESAQKEEPSLEDTIDFLSKLGLDKDVAYGMEGHHLTTLVENIAGTAKK